MILDTFLIMDHFVIIWFIDRQLDDDVRTWKATFFSYYCYIPSSTFHVIVQHIGPGNISWNCTKLFETESSELWVAFADFVLSFDPFVYIGNCSMSNILPLPAQSQREIVVCECLSCLKPIDRWYVCHQTDSVYSIFKISSKLNSLNPFAYIS